MKKVSRDGRLVGGKLLRPSVAPVLEKSSGQCRPLAAPLPIIDSSAQ